MSVTTTNQGSMLDSEDLGPADEKLLDMLNEGRVTAPYASEKTGYSLQYVRDRLGRLVEHGNARKVYEGLYELVEDPREERDPDE
ncbi:MarR family transcriptional regulator [Natronorubrum halalkaliphilum]|nr:MarR family transcriptional regulator [Natronorubrum halalkaliphilum]